MKLSKELELESLRRNKNSTPEQRLDWLAAAVEFAQAAKEGRKKKNE